MTSKPPARDYRVPGMGGGGFKFLLVLVLLLASIVAVGEYRYDKSPQEMWQWVVAFAHDQIYPPAPPPPPSAVAAKPVAPPALASTPARAPEQATAPSPPRPAPEPDPLTWLLAHEEHWPPEVTLKGDTLFPILSNGKMAGSGNVPAGSQLQLLEIVPPNVTLVCQLYGGGSKSVPIDSTDLVERAKAELHNAEIAALAPKVAPTAAPPLPKTDDTPKSSSPNLVLDHGESEDAFPGAIYKPQGTTFRIFAEKAKSVKLVLYDAATGDAGRSVRALEQSQDGLWDATVSGDLRGKYYAYLLDGPDLDPTREVLDPYAVNAVGNATRGRITAISDATGNGPPVESATDMVIYEMHVRDFTIDGNSGVQHPGLYLGWTEGNTHLTGDGEIKTALDHLVELGVTHVQIMPVEDFGGADGSYNWGYMTDAYLSPEGMFATNPADDSRVREFKALVDALHAHGIGVILDVVFNHTSSRAPFEFIDPTYYYRHLPDGSFANGAGCGNEFRSEAPMARKLILDSLRFWVKEYGVDGFRFDLMALIDRKTMRDAKRELHEINPNIVIYGEPWEPGESPLRDQTDKDALADMQTIGGFNDDFRNALKGPPDGAEPGWIQNGSNLRALKAAMLVSNWLASPAQSINYLTCHDNLTLWDKLKISMPDASDTLIEDTMKLGYLALFTSQGVPFLQGGEEFARTKGGNNNSYDAPDAVNEVDWSLKKTHLGLFNYTRDLIALRKAHPLFRLRTRDQISERLNFEDTPDEKTLMFTLDGAGVPVETWSRVCVVLNSDDSAAAQIDLPPGHWSVALDAAGASTSGESMSGKITVRAKSGLVLYRAK